MKKNLMSVLILALVITNVALTAILMISIVPQSQKANDLITKVCSAIDLELEGGKDNATINVPMEQLEMIEIASGQSITVNLKDTEDGRKGFAVISLSIAMDTKNEGYKTYGAEGITAKESLIKDELNRIISSHTLDDLRDNKEELKDEVVKSLRKMYDSDFIVSVTFPIYNYEQQSGGGQ
ncbi:flagellar basal body-associated FliL family protein [Lachnospiraceae bacterium 29-84]